MGRYRAIFHFSLSAKNTHTPNSLFPIDMYTSIPWRMLEHPLWFACHMPHNARLLSHRTLKVPNVWCFRKICIRDCTLFLSLFQSVQSHNKFSGHFVVSHSPSKTNNIVCPENHTGNLTGKSCAIAFSANIPEWICDA